MDKQITEIDVEKLWTEKLVGRAWQIKEEFLELLRIMIKKDVKHVLEIGAYKGGTALGFLSIGCGVVSIDPEKQPEIAELEVGFLHKYTFIKEKSENAIVTGFADMLWIDGNHDYENVKGDYEKYKDKAIQLIAFHDIVDSELHRKQNCGVPKFWNEVKIGKHYEEIVFDGTWGGIGVLYL